MPKESGKLRPEDFFSSTSHRRMQYFFGGLTTETRDIAKGLFYGGMWLDKHQVYDLFGLNNLFKGQTTKREEAQAKQNLNKLAEDTFDKVSNGMFDTTSFWMQTHPSRHWTDSLASGVGEQVAQLPLYAAIGTARGIATAASGLERLNLTQQLLAKPVGKFVANRIGEAVDGYFGAVLQNKSSEATSNALSFAAFGGLGAGLAIPSRLLMKQVVAKFASVGGHPFINALSDIAKHELDNGIIGYTPKNEPIAIRPTDLKAGTGYVQVGNETMPYTSQQHLQEIINRVQKYELTNDPVRTKAVQAEKLTLSTLAHERFGKLYSNLSPKERAAVDAEHDQLVGEAINEAAIHNPDIAKEHIENDIREDQKRNPALAEYDAAVEKASGFKISDKVHETEQEKIKAETGIRQSQGVANKINNLATRSARERVITPAMEEEPHKFAQLKESTISYFINSAKKAGSDEALTKQLRDTDSEEFLGNIKEMFGNMYKFENSEHMLLWANAFRGDLPRPFQTRLMRELREMHPTQTVKDFNRASDNLATHMGLLAKTGKLFTEGNVFRSTRIADWTSPTKWQRQLKREAAAIQTAQLKKIMQRFPNEYKMITDALFRIQGAK